MSDEIKEQLQLFADAAATISPPISTGINSSNTLAVEDKPIHSWYRFVLSYPPHLVRHYINEFKLEQGQRILDPFCGTGTTVVEAKRQGLAGIGVEANLFPHFASSVKVDWDVDPDELLKCAAVVAKQARIELKSQGIDELDRLETTPTTEMRTLSPEVEKLLITNSISPLPLHKTLLLLECLKTCTPQRSHNHLLLALGNALVTQIGNLKFGPEVGVGKQKKDVLVIPSWLAEVKRMADDLRSVKGERYEDAEVHLADARNIPNILEPHSINAVITSPPYPNEKDYTRTTRLESVLLGFYTTNTELRALKRNLVRSNTRGVYSTDTDDHWVQHIDEIQSIANTIEQRRVELGKTSGFERLYASLRFGQKSTR
jgi:hypothetical protein